MPIRKSVIAKDINPEKDIYLGETSVQITGFHNWPSVHLVKSYMVHNHKDIDELEQNVLYHIFEYKTGTTVINYRPQEYEQVAKFLDISDHWSIFYYYEDDGLVPVSKSWRLPEYENAD